MRLLFLLLVMLLTRPAGAEGGTVGYDQIVVVTAAIEHYDGWGDLPNAPRDVELFLDALEGPWDAPVQVVRLAEAEATKVGILRALDLAATEAGKQKNSLLVFYFAGHGTTEKNAGYLVPYGGKRGDYTTWLSMTELEGFAADRAAAVPHQLYILGSCFSGALLKTRMRGEDELRKQQLVAGWRQAELKRTARIGLTAGSERQSIPDGAQGQGSAFGQAVANALRGVGGGRAADYDGDGCIDKFELATYVHGHGKTRHNTPRMGPMRGDNSGVLALCTGRFSAPPKVTAYAAGQLRGTISAGHAAGEQMAEATGHRPGLRHIPAGTFLMGSPAKRVDRDETQHPVTLSRPFWMMETEVTQGQYRAVTDQSPAYFSQCGAACPVERVSWRDALAYANALSVREALSPCYMLRRCEGVAGDGCGEGEASCQGGYDCRVRLAEACTGYRLPTEAEWEYAARAGRAGVWHAALNSAAWYDENAGGAPKVVGGKAANAWGLHDMLGNVWEWCGDRFDIEYGVAPQTDPTGPVRGGGVVVRGGAWNSSDGFVRWARRSWKGSRMRTHGLGFRLVRRPDVR